MRPILATVYLHALRHNLAAVRKFAPRSKVMAVVKANGYGHGLINVAHGLGAADGFAVLGIDEAINLRDAGFQQTILLLEGVFCEQELNVASSFGLNIVVHSMPQLIMLESATLIKPMHIHLKMNTGMNRLGFQPNTFTTAYERLKACKNVADITLMTHFATADDEIGIEKPFSLFKRITQDLPSPVSLANSATILRHSDAHADWVRPGIMLYGASPVGDTAATTYDLIPAMQLTSELIGVQEVQAGESVGYGNRFTATKATRIGIVACGYADGYPRHAGLVSGCQQGGAPIAVAGKLTSTLGRVSMDMLFCDLTNIPEANIGSPVELWGKHVPVDAVAAASDTVSYELLCAVAPRVPMKVAD
ncbi:MAG: alanine racemase [Methylotenera sp.]|jgi:alanine racemase|uniref:alanine racemase n=1 Tax=Methylotenera sp. TaxID=2051956 RepID=UPI002717F76B|nr:alanine racemase [Methylotenera sp.]MDO9150967.1 alanine racemase [Methylotenera sp.]